MFRYQDNGKVSKPQEIQRKVVTHIRQVTYINPGKRIEAAKGAENSAENVVTQGFEVVQEAVVSPDFVCVPVVVGSKIVYHKSLLNKPQDD